MKYAPKHTDKTMRILYILLFGAALVLMTLPFNEGIPRTVIICLSIISLVSAMYLIVRYELTTYTYILNPKGKDYDFFVDKAVGKRGNYVCSYQVSSIVKVVPYEKDTRESLKKEYQNIFIYNYTHNSFTDKKQVIVFRNTPNYEAVVCELGDEMESFLKSIIELIKEERKVSYNIELERQMNEED